jgi:hypothetical protein
MNYKRGKSKNSRAGCLMCKPNIHLGWPKHKDLGHKGFGKLRDEAHARQDLLTQPCSRVIIEVRIAV